MLYFSPAVTHRNANLGRGLDYLGILELEKPDEEKDGVAGLDPAAELHGLSNSGD